MTKRKSNTPTGYVKTGTSLWVWEDETTENPELYKLAAYFDPWVEQIEDSLFTLAVSVKTGILWDVPISCPLESYEDFGDEYLYIRRDFLHEVFKEAHRFVEAGASIQHN